MMKNFFKSNKRILGASVDSEKNFFMKDFDDNSNLLTYQRRLNDYDYNILDKEAYRDLSDELFRLEYKISELEEQISSLNGQIQAARDISDYNAVEYLSGRKELLVQVLKETENIYNEKSLSSKISGGILGSIAEVLKKIGIKLRLLIFNFKEILSPILPARYSSSYNIRKSLVKLQNISKSVDELMSMETPYGENAQKYEQLSKYIIRANYIHNKISKSIK